MAHNSTGTGISISGYILIFCLLLCIAGWRIVTGKTFWSSLPEETMEAMLVLEVY